MYKKEKKKKMFKTSESYIYDIRVRTSTIHFNLSVFLILCYVRPINIPIYMICETFLLLFVSWHIN